MVLVGIDPSFTGLGITIIDTEKKEIYLEELKTKMGKTFQETFQSSIHLCSKVVSILKDRNVNYILSEEPFAGAMSSPGLYQLDSLIFSFLLIHLTTLDSLYNSHPSYLKGIHKKAKYSKKESTTMAHKFLDVFLDKGYTCNKTKFSHNVSESLIYATRLYCKEHKEMNIVKVKLLQANPYLAENKEKLLFKKYK